MTRSSTIRHLKAILKSFRLFSFRKQAFRYVLNHLLILAQILTVPGTSLAAGESNSGESMPPREGCKLLFQSKGLGAATNRSATTHQVSRHDDKESLFEKKLIDGVKLLTDERYGIETADAKLSRSQRRSALINLIRMGGMAARMEDNGKKLMLGVDLAGVVLPGYEGLPPLPNGYSLDLRYDKVPGLNDSFKLSAVNLVTPTKEIIPLTENPLENDAFELKPDPLLWTHSLRIREDRPRIEETQFVDRKHIANLIQDAYQESGRTADRWPELPDSRRGLNSFQILESLKGLLNPIDSLVWNRLGTTLKDPVRQIKVPAIISGKTLKQFEGFLRYRDADPTKNLISAAEMMAVSNGWNLFVLKQKAGARLVRNFIFSRTARGVAKIAGLSALLISMGYLASVWVGHPVEMRDINPYHAADKVLNLASKAGAISPSSKEASQVFASIMKGVDSDWQKKNPELAKIINEAKLLRVTGPGQTGSGGYDGFSTFVSAAVKYDSEEMSNGGQANYFFGDMLGGQLNLNRATGIPLAPSGNSHQTTVIVSQYTSTGKILMTFARSGTDGKMTSISTILVSKQENPEAFASLSARLGQVASAAPFAGALP